MKTFREAELVLENRALRIELERERRKNGSTPTPVGYDAEIPMPVIETVTTIPTRTLVLAGSLDARLDERGLHVALKCIPTHGKSLHVAYFLDNLVMSTARDVAGVMSNIHEKTIWQLATACLKGDFK